MRNRDVVSQIRSLNKLFSDATLNDRVILQECRNVANLLVHQDLDRRKLTNSPNLYAFIPCLAMEEAPLQECCEYYTECTIAKSVRPLPKIGEGIWGLAIQGVFGIDGRVKLKEINPNRYANILKLKLKTNDVYYWVMNNHLYVTNPDTKSINLYAYFTEDIPNDLLYPGEGCNCISKPDIDTLCASYMDKKFYFPDYRINDLQSIVEKNLLQSYFNVPTDRNSDNKDDQSK